MSSRIYILSRPVQSGKTTLLQEWVRGKQGVEGILTPDVNGMRKLYDIGTGIYSDLEVNRTGENVISIGRFHFHSAGFAHARKLLLDARDRQPAWLVVDEIGKLELVQQKGLEPVVSELTDFYQYRAKQGYLLLIIRDYLLEPAINHYKIERPVIVNNLDEL